MILAGDIGGTHARFALFADDGKTLVRKGDVESQRFASATTALELFLNGQAVQSACLGIAGPVISGACNATNLPWRLSESVIAAQFGIARVRLVNDLVAIAYGAMALDSDSLTKIQVGFPRKEGANIAVIAAGTGLGEAALIWDGRRFVPLATEGGHCDFAGRDELGRELSRFFQKRYEHVSVERVLSGSGLALIYEHFCEKGAHESPEITEQIRSATDRNAAITQLANSGKSEIAARAVDTFVELLGYEAGNFALKTLALGGVFVVGAIANALRDRIVDGVFARSFIDKGRMSGLLSSVPVALVTSTDIGLIGSAHLAALSHN